MDGGALHPSAVVSKETLKFRYASEQTWDASCGYAALAALLSHYRGLALGEADLLASTAASGEGLVKVSLGQLLRLVQGLGFKARAGRVEFSGLSELLGASSPLLVHYDRPSGHFALLLAVGPEGVVTADPARGLELLSREQFLARWSGTVLLVSDPRRAGPPPEVAEAVKTAHGRARLVDRALSKGPPKR